ncbi:DUF2484 family protein [Maritimibacter fusiformis]|uniref:DUF2484 family protein n=1 Tax=Maritimibacter fusiformis TaxID=2603819 RepID=A0A5D0RHB7_9RHOB|nr:DUF2484 family protein [Maritimibacter fusiformis]TYB80922.1 DUF2484 family protein [Maritimibacter fusiformis]
MTPSLIAACLWALGGTVTAFLPMRYQMIPGSLLLLTAIPLMIWIGAENGWVWTGLALAAFLSMMRRPLGYLIARARGQKPELPR